MKKLYFIKYLKNKMMEVEQIYEVITTLIGDSQPCADSAIDTTRKENMKKFIEITSNMHDVIADIAYRYSNSPYASAKEIGVLAYNYLCELGIAK